MVGATANALVCQIDFGAMGYSQLGASGLQTFGDYGKNVGNAVASLTEPALGQFASALASNMNTAFHS